MNLNKDVPQHVTLTHGRSPTQALGILIPSAWTDGT
jgi:hypothetical protein